MTRIAPRSLPWIFALIIVHFAAAACSPPATEAPPADTPAAETQAESTGGESTNDDPSATPDDTVTYEPAYPEDVSTEALDAQDVDQQESTHSHGGGAPHSHGESGTHSHNGDGEDDHEH